MPRDHHVDYRLPEDGQENALLSSEEVDPGANESTTNENGREPKHRTYLHAKVE